MAFLPNESQYIIVLIIMHKSRFAYDSKYFVSRPKSIEKDPAVKWFRTLIEDVAKTLIPYPEP